MPMKNISSKIEDQVNSVSAWFLSQDDEQLSARPAPGKWSRKEIIGHLCDSAMNNIQRFIRGQYEENSRINYEQDNWVSLSAYNSRSKEELIALWSSLNKHLCRIIEHMPPENHNRTCIMMSLGNETKSYTLKWIAEDYLRHMEHHLNNAGMR